MIVVCFFFKQKTAYEMRISDWSSDVCSSDLLMDVVAHACECGGDRFGGQLGAGAVREPQLGAVGVEFGRAAFVILDMRVAVADDAAVRRAERGEREAVRRGAARRSEEHTSELQSLMCISYAVFCLKKKKKNEESDKSSNR